MNEIKGILGLVGRNIIAYMVYIIAIETGAISDTTFKIIGALGVILFSIFGGYSDK